MSNEITFLGLNKINLQIDAALDRTGDKNFILPETLEENYVIPDAHHLRKISEEKDTTLIDEFETLFHFEDFVMYLEKEAEKGKWNKKYKKDLEDFTEQSMNQLLDITKKLRELKYKVKIFFGVPRFENSIVMEVSWE